MPQTSHMFWLADGFDHMSEIPKIDASLVKSLFERSSVHRCLVGMEAPIHLFTNMQILVIRLFHSICRMQAVDCRTKPGIWWVTMNDAASLSSRSCSFVASLSAWGNNIPLQRDKQKCHFVLFNIFCVYVNGSFGFSYNTWRKDIWIEAHLEDDVAHWADFFTSSSHCIGSSWVIWTNKRLMVKLKMSKELYVFSIDSHPRISLLTSCCTFFKASTLIQLIFDKLSELGMSAKKTPNITQEKLRKWIQ